jgi:transposase InsO family protein
VKRHFTAECPDQLWVADFTYVPMISGFGYTAFVIDAFAGRIVGWECSLSKETVFVESAIRQAATFRAVDPENRLVARGLEAEWNTALKAVADAETELARRETTRPKTLTPQEKQAILELGDDLGAMWSAPTTTDKDRKQLLRTLLEEVQITVRRDDADPHADFLLRHCQVNLDHDLLC